MDKSDNNRVVQILHDNMGLIKGLDLVILPPDINPLTPNLILCSASSVTPNLLDLLGVKCVINVAPELPDCPVFSTSCVQYEKIDVNDSGNSRIYPHFDTVANLIQKVAMTGNKTLIYCVAGVSRSATLCLAYLMKHLNLSLLESYNFLKSKRPKIKPNCGFFKQLIEYEKLLYGDCNNTVHMIFNDFVQMEIPDVYDFEYQSFVGLYNYGGAKGRLLRQPRSRHDNQNNSRL